MSRIRLAGATRAAIVIGALALFPFLVGQQWVQIGVLTLMYAGLATATAYAPTPKNATWPSET